MDKFCIVTTTIDTKEASDKVINAVLERAAASSVKRLEISNHYVWRDAIYHENEYLLVFNTVWDLEKKLEEIIRQFHSYDDPEILSFDAKRNAVKNNKKAV